MSEVLSVQQLKSVIDRIERLEEEKRALASDVRDIYSEAKSKGFEPKILRQIVRLRRKAEAERREEQELIDIYATAIGMR